MTERLTDQICTLAAAASPAGATGATLVRLAATDLWSGDDHAAFESLARRIDIDRQLSTTYDESGRPAGPPLADQAALGLLVALLLRAALEAAARPVALCRLNTLFKAMELVETPWLAPGTPLRAALDDCLVRRVASMESVDPDPLSPWGAAAPRTVPLTILYYEGPIARAYLATMAALGLRAARLINLVATDDLLTRRPVGRWLPPGLRLGYAAAIQRRRIHFWPRQLARAQPALKAAFDQAVEAALAVPAAVIANAQALRPLRDDAESYVELPFRGWRDPALHAALAAEPPSTLLFTGGGIVPASLLSLSHLRLLHIHPGHLPEIRGADGTLWSLLLAGRPSASCFYMAPGIDTGDVVLARWLPEVDVAVDAGGFDLRTRYRATYAFLDPWVRAVVLRELLTAHDRFDRLPAVRQSTAGGMTYRFMQARMQSAVFDRLFGAPT